ncbi:MAG: hypothetical protein KDD22_08850, partial [Bdellovibrionales bacterium]|nr:hypothetical protein [Bdellovibrionales bacterium]
QGAEESPSPNYGPAMGAGAGGASPNQGPLGLREPQGAAPDYYMQRPGQGGDSPRLNREQRRRAKKKKKL